MNTRRKESIVCRHCGKDRDRAHGQYASLYCSNACQQEAQYQAYIARYLAGEEDGVRAAVYVSHRVRRWLFETRGDACEECGWSRRNPVTGTIPLHIDHVDGDSRNARPENLKLLCPNCHSITPTFGSLNMGKGRESRRKDFRDGSEVV